MIGEIWGYTTVGIAQSQEEMDKHLENNKPNWGTGWAAGDVMFADLNGDDIVNNGSNTLEDHGDITIIGNNKPRYKFGLTLDGAWKGIDFSVFFQGVLKRDYMLSGPYFWGANGANGSQPASLNIWITGLRKTQMHITRDLTSVQPKTSRPRLDICRMLHICV